MNENGTHEDKYIVPKREWMTYAVKAVFSEDPDKNVLWPIIPKETIDEYNNSVLENWHAHIYKNQNPILTTGTIDEIFKLNRGSKGCRIYPPFPLNEQEEVSGIFKDVAVPVGKLAVERMVQIPESCVKGLCIEFDKMTHCHGLRFDVEGGLNANDIYKCLIDQICQFTHQWWLRSSQSPFRGPLRLGAAINKHYETLEELRYHGAGKVESTWHAIRMTKNTLGYRPLDKNIWRLCMHNLQNKIPAEIGILTFSDAIASYMADDDEKCVINLALCFEILANKQLLIDKLKTESSIMTLIKRTKLVKKEDEQILKKLIIDRGHVAHGRPIQNIGKNEITIEKYISSVALVVNNYLKIAGAQAGKWQEMASTLLTKEKTSHK